MDGPPSVRTPLARLLLGLGVLLGVLLPALPLLQAAELAGTRFDDGVNLGGQALKLNGLGLRTVFVVKAYVAGLYVSERSRNVDELLAQKGPRRLTLKMLIDMSPERMVRSFNEGLEKNHTEAELLALRPAIDQLIATMKALGTTRKGDSVDIESIDDQTRLSVNGKFIGEAIASSTLFAAILRIFLGPHPADSDLKRGLLGT